MVCDVVVVVWLVGDVGSLAGAGLGVSYLVWCGCAARNNPPPLFISITFGVWSFFFLLLMMPPSRTSRSASGEGGAEKVRPGGGSGRSFVTGDPGGPTTRRLRA